VTLTKIAFDFFIGVAMINRVIRRVVLQAGHDRKRINRNTRKELNMNAKSAVKWAASAAVLGVALASSGAVFAEDVLDSGAIAQAADQAQFDKAVAKREARLHQPTSVRSERSDRADRGFAEMDKRLREESMLPGGTGG
jgi:hypothetical protein